MRKSMDPPVRPSMTAFVMYHRARCSGSVSASHTTWTGCGMRRSNARVAYSPTKVSVPVRVERVEALLGPARGLHELRLSEDPEVPRYAGLREAWELGGDASRISGTPREQVEYGSTCGVCDRREDIGRHHRIPAGWPWVFTLSAEAGGLTRAASGGCRRGP